MGLLLKTNPLESIVQSKFELISKAIESGELDHYTKVMNKYGFSLELDGKHIADEASWFNSPGYTLADDAEQEVPRYCYRCSKPISGLSAYTHPDISQSMLRLSDRAVRDICKSCYDLMERTRRKRAKLAKLGTFQR